MRRGLARGAIAGAVVYGGKRIIASETPLAWWAGRQLAAVGASEVANASLGLPILQRIVLPLGPIRIHIDRAGEKKIAARLDLASSIAVISRASQANTHFALDESLATGTIVFLTPDLTNAVGSHSAGVLAISDFLPDGDFPELERKRGVLSHEIIHALQYDFTFTAWSDAAQSGIAKRIPGGRQATRFIDFNLILPFQLLGNGLVAHDDRPWEREASSLVKTYR